MGGDPVIPSCSGYMPTLAVTTSATNGVGMGIATMFVLVASNIMISILRKVIPDMVEFRHCIIIASFVTDLMMAAFTPELHHSLGIFIPLIVVNCIVLYARPRHLHQSIIL